MLSKSTEYALRSLVFIQLCNWERKRPGVGEIAKEIDAPLAYTAKILQTLTKNKLLNSAKGRGGGFFFDENQSNSTLYDVIHVVEGDASFHKCGFGLNQCNDKNPCPFHDKYKFLRDGFLEIVKTETIKSFSEKIQHGDAVLKSVIQTWALSKKTISLNIKVWIEEGCTSCGMCEDICPEIFEMPDVAKVIQGAISGKTKPGIAVQTEHIWAVLFEHTCQSSWVNIDDNRMVVDYTNLFPQILATKWQQRKNHLDLRE